VNVHDSAVHEIPLPRTEGRLSLAGKRAVAPDPEDALDRADADTVVCLVHAAEVTDHWPAYVEWLAANRGGAAVWWPIDDLSAPPLVDFVPLLREVERRLGQGEHLLVHCGAGIGRAGTLAVAVLMLHGMPPEHAVAHVRRHRPMAGPEVGAQRDLIVELATRLEM
jgi:protein-tyrosine phosphatase